MTTTCVSCGQTFAIPQYAERPRGEQGLLARVKCHACRTGQYGGDERHESVRLFTPAPNQISGQLSL
jgi:hypothetical protein